MPDPAPPADQFWLMTAEVPSGPFTVAEIHAKLAAQEATWETLACRVGGGVWLPLLRTPGIGPTASAAGDSPPATGESEAKSDPTPAAPPTPPAHTPFTPFSTPTTDAGTNSPTPPPPESKPTPWIDWPTRQAIQVGIGVLLMAAFLAVAKGCKEDSKNSPTLQERLKEQRNNNPLPPVPPPKTTLQP